MITLASSSQGQGQTLVLLLHGIGGGKAIWSDMVSGTASAIAKAGFVAVALDLPGYGESPALPKASLSAMVQALAGFIAHQPLRRVVLVGHSMGGMLAQELVAQAPQLVHGLVLACTSASFGRADGAWQSQFIAQRLAPLDAGLGMRGMAERLVPEMVSPMARPGAMASAQEVMSCVPEATYRAALQLIVGFDRRESLAAIAVPTLCLAGEDDRTAPPDLLLRMSQRIPGAEYHCLGDAGHIANVEQPAAFNAAVVDFLTRRFSSE